MYTYSASLKKNYILANDEWKEDIVPETMDGHNVYDFIDHDILHRLEELEQEDGLQQAEVDDDDFEIDGKELTLEEQQALAEIRKKTDRQNRQTLKYLRYIKCIACLFYLSLSIYFTTLEVIILDAYKGCILY